MVVEKTFHRLPTDVIPINYSLTIHPNIIDFTFRGNLMIELDVKKSTNRIILNCLDICIDGVRIYNTSQDFGKNTIEIAYQEVDETVSLCLPEDLIIGTCKLSIEYRGTINDKMKGFCRCRYNMPDGESRYGSYTQFEATNARMALPCWDEPAIKATFDLSLIVPNDKVALSNMPVKSESESKDFDGFKHLVFERSPTMSVYLLAWVIGDYEFVETTDDDGVKIRVYTSVGKKDQGKFALEVARRTLPFYKSYFNVSYPLPKIDLVAISDFSAGAMENWGLVTYRETALLIDDLNSSIAARQRVAIVVGHELAHQWFGNLVTMEWWTHLWLNEGFAEWIEYLCVDHCFPEFDIWDQFVSTDFTKALELDALDNSHQIEVPIGNPSEIEEIFDAISYSKGASVIRMLHNYIGDEDFRSGMHHYLVKHKYQNTVTEDLWEALGNSSGKPIAQIMSTWTQQKGFPLLKVREEQQGSDTRLIHIVQEKFSAGGFTEDESLWMIPISFISSSQPNKVIHQIIMESKEITVTLKNVEQNDWVKLNSGSTAFYRVQYSKEMLNRLIPAVHSKSMSARDRLGLQSDIFALSLAGSCSTVDALRLVSAFSDETNLTVWQDLTVNLGVLSTLLQYTDVHEQFLNFRRNLYSEIYNKLGWEVKADEGPQVSMLRGMVISAMGMSNDKTAINEAVDKFNGHIEGSYNLPADLRGSVYSIVMANGNKETLEQLLKLFHKTDLQEEQIRLISSMGKTKNEPILAQVLDFALSNDVRPQDTMYVLYGAASTKIGRQLTWQFLQDKWSTFDERYRGSGIIQSIIQLCLGRFSSECKAKEIKAFFEKNPAPGAERTVQQVIEKIRLSSLLLDRDREAITKFLSTF